MKIFGDTQSGNCYKVKLLCALLGISHQWVPVDILAGETATAQFLSKNPTGKIPLLESGWWPLSFRVQRDSEFPGGR